MSHSRSRFITRLEAAARSPGYIAMISFLAAADAYVFVIPLEALLIPAVLLRKEHWFRVSIWISLGSAIGSVSFAWLCAHYGIQIVQHLAPQLIASHEWQEAARIIRRDGGWALGLFSFSILPQHPAVAIAGLAGMPMDTVFISVLVGRVFKYALLSWVVIRFPAVAVRLLHRTPSTLATEKAVVSQPADPPCQKNKRRSA